MKLCAESGASVHSADKVSSARCIHVFFCKGLAWAYSTGTLCFSVCAVELYALTITALALIYVQAGNTALHKASAGGHTHAVEMLLVGAGAPLAAIRQ